MAFSQIKGHQIPIKILLNSLKRGILSPSYVFIGPIGIGKEFISLNFAKAINCFNPVDSDCCDKCSSCLKIQNYNHPDVHWIRRDEPGSIKIETIRNLQKIIYLKPWEAKHKVFIICEAENLTPEAQNSLLKILEEPPKENILILITSKPNLVFSTIISRCKRIMFSSLDVDSLKKILIQDFGFSDLQAHFLAYFSEGRYRRALEFKERNLFNEKKTILSHFLERNLFSEDNSNIKDLIKNREGFNLILSILISWFRDILLLKRGIFDRIINIDQKERFSKFQDRYTEEELEDIYRMLKEAAFYYEQNVNPKLILNYIKVNLWKG